MEQYFSEITERKNTRAVKWDLVKTLYGADDILPMWVADMDFKVPPAVTEALVDRAKHGIFGYTYTDKAYNKIVTDWVQYKHQWAIDNGWILYSPGVISTLNIAIQALTEEEDKVLIQTPVYPPFYNIVQNHNRALVKNELIYKDNSYQIDFEDFEAKLKEGVKVFILCNPHNPVGRVWNRSELEQILALCKKYHVFILSDEIHADIIHEPNKHIPIASLDEEMLHQTITCMSPTKTFNLAGLQASYAIIPDQEIRKKISQAFEKQGIHGINTMGITALEAAYTEGKDWLHQLMLELNRNIDYVMKELSRLEEVDVTKPEGTYLIWLDFTKLNLSQKELKKFLEQKAKVGLNDGVTFGEEGTGFMRMNLAAPFQLIKEGTDRIRRAIEERKG